MTIKSRIMVFLVCALALTGCGPRASDKSYKATSGSVNLAHSATDSYDSSQYHGDIFNSRERLILLISASDPTMNIDTTGMTDLSNLVGNDRSGNAIQIVGPSNHIKEVKMLAYTTNDQADETFKFLVMLLADNLDATHWAEKKIKLMNNWSHSPNVDSSTYNDKKIIFNYKPQKKTVTLTIKSA